MRSPERGGMGMRRRGFLGALGGAAAWPLAASAQRSQPMRRIGHSARRAAARARTSGVPAGACARMATCRDRITCWSHNGGTAIVARLPELAVALVNAGVDIIVTEGAISVRAAHAVTGTIPIVFTRAADPFVFGLVTESVASGWQYHGLLITERGYCRQDVRNSQGDRPRTRQGCHPGAAPGVRICFLRPKTRPLIRLESSLSTLR